MMNAHRSSPLQSTKKEGEKKREKNSRKAKLLRFHLLSISGATMCGRRKRESENTGRNKQTNKQKRKPRRFLRSLQVFAKNKDTMKTTTKLHCGKIGMLTHHRRTRSSQSTSLPRSTAAQVMTPTLISLLPY